MANGIVDDDETVLWSDRNEGAGSPREFQNPVSFQSDETSPKRQKLSPIQQGSDDQSAEESSPLGLNLKKTASFISLIETKLSERNNHMAKLQDFMSQPMSEKLKASNFRAIHLKIGTWQRISKHEGDLVAKCYYAKRKLVWEVLEGALKSKIEIQWSDIMGIRATIIENEPGILEVELNQPPLFFRETNPQPRKHTLWQAAPDFTGGQAPTYRRHYVKFAPGTLDKHYEKLLQCDERLFMLSQRPFPSQQSPLFDTNVYGFSLDFNHRPSPQILNRLQYPNYCPSFPPPSALPLRYQALIRSNSGPPALRIADNSLIQPIPAGHGITGECNFAMENQTNVFWNGADQINIADHANDHIQMPSPVFNSVSQTNVDFLTQNFNAMTANRDIVGTGTGISTANGLLNISGLENHFVCPTPNERALLGNTTASSLDPLMLVGQRVVGRDQVMVNIERNSLQNGGLLWPEPINWIPHSEFSATHVMQQRSRNHYPYDFPNQTNQGF